VREIDPGEQKDEIAPHGDRGTLVLGGPRKRPALEPLVEHPEPAVISRQNLEAIAATIAKQKQVPGQRIEIEALAHERRQAVNRSAEIGGAGRQVDLNRGGARQHADRRALTVARTKSAEAPARTCRRSPLLNMSSITGLSSPVTCTGTNGAGGGSGADVADSLRCQYQNAHGDRRWRRAKLAPDSPLVRHCATRRAMRAAVRLFAIRNPPERRIRQTVVLLKTRFVERLLPNVLAITCGAKRRQVHRSVSRPPLGSTRHMLVHTIARHCGLPGLFCGSLHS
jgi:hypothetical protein